MAAPVKAPMTVAEWVFRLVEHGADPTFAIEEYWSPREAWKVWEYLDREMMIAEELSPPGDPISLGLHLHVEDRTIVKAKWPLLG